MARISTHVLDLAKGRPAAGVRVEFFRDGVAFADELTDADGRIGAVIGAEGSYELVFHAGDYLASAGSFYDLIPIRFTVSDPDGKYHVPLLLAAHGYSTYRGS